MKQKRFFSAALSAALLVSLCACAPKEPVEDEDPSAGGSASGAASSMEGPVGTSFEDPSASDPMAPPPPEYDKEHRLDAEIPALIDGFELPINGATGYTSVELPVWPRIPKEPTQSNPAQTSSGSGTSTEGATGGTGSSAPAPGDPVVLDPGHSSASDPGSSAETGAAAPEGGTTESEDMPSAPEGESAPPPDPYKDAVAVWGPGTAFVIIAEDDHWWYVAREDVSGWIDYRYCMINLPDVVPSIIYNDTNAYSSLFVSCGKDIPDVTGTAFYDTLAYNERLARDEFMMPILYSAALRICEVQHKALAEGNCLVIYQTFRPYDTQRAVVKGLTKLSNDDPEVKAGISTSPWSMAWFISTGYSNHQRGYALDVSMVKVYKTEKKYSMTYPYLRMTDYEDYKMPTAMHELSIAAISTISPSSSQLSETMNEPALALREYFTSSGLSPLPSEWWHFNDFTARKEASDNPSDGRYFITECLSCLPGLASSDSPEDLESDEDMEAGDSLETDGSLDSGNSLETDGSLESGNSLETDGSLESGNSLETDGSLDSGNSLETGESLESDESQKLPD